ncbi:hypothetical protein Rhal01_03324 [Rubritalea halochordaticola]|uniref:Long-chain-fatty-acyl-CoA reductase n=1 Tax=Rubritalea halochordaticola TaxID=714537 RepID=A0ABP9V6G9_9BACT
MTTQQRADILATLCADYTAFLGEFSADDLIDWVTLELQHDEALDAFVPYGDIRSKAVPLSPIVHVVSGNTPHAALQSILRGLLLGAKNIVKLPSSGLPEVEEFAGKLPAELQPLLTLSTRLDQATLSKAKAVVAIGSDEAIAAIHSRLSAHQRFIPHGHKLSIGLIEQPSTDAASKAARDIGLFKQQGCLSLHTVYVKESPQEFARMLATAMQRFEEENPRGPISISESGAISNLRETYRYHAAVEPENYLLLESKQGTAWTIIFENNARLVPSPLNRTVYVRPWPVDLGELGSETQYLSTIALDPLDELLEEVESLSPPRICSLGEGQQPPLIWHHDGFPPLSSLVSWRDIH